MPSRKPTPAGPPPSALIDERIATLGDWRGAMLAELRALILDAQPGIEEDWKWSGPCWTHAGLLCTGETYQRHVKLTFPHGASLPDPTGLFNSSLEGRVRRAIDFPEGATIDGPALQALIRAAAAHNASKGRAQA